MTDVRAMITYINNTDVNFITTHMSTKDNDNLPESKEIILLQLDSVQLSLIYFGVQTKFNMYLYLNVLSKNIM